MATCLQCKATYGRRPSVLGKYCSRICASTARRGKRQDLLARFWRRVEKTKTCWLWTGHVGRNGYGTIQIDHYPVLVHRFAFEQASGRSAAGKVVRHSCDVRVCVNPAHLLLGTSRENSADMVARGRAAFGLKNGAHRHPERHPRGDRHGNTRLSDADVAEMRALYTGRRGEITALATHFGTSVVNASLILRGLARR